MNGRALKKIYHDPSHFASFSGKRKLLNAFKKKFSTNFITAWLDKEPSYNKHKLIKNKFLRRSYSVSNVDDLWECDLIDMRFLKTYNDDCVYLLSVIDVFSKHAWIEPLKNKSSQATIRGFTNILKRSAPRTPICLQSDKGKEFVNSDFQTFLKKKNIRFRVARNPTIKAAVVERFNRTLKERMWRFFTYSRSKRYIDILQQLVDSYNKAYHRTIKTTPSSVTLDNAHKLRNLMSENVKKMPKRKVKYSVGDLVRISSAKTAFQKGYESGWTSEVFYISRVLDQRAPTVYTVSDLDGEEIDGIFYEEELSSLGLKLPKKALVINKILDTRGRGKQKRVLVNWTKLPEDCLSWILASKSRIKK